MHALIVVDNAQRWPLDVPGATVVSARTYLTDPGYGADRRARVFNLCRSYRYQSLGYYVSLLAEARGHKPLPRAATIEDLKSPNLVRLLAEDLEESIARVLAPLRSERFELSIYFGRNMTRRYDALTWQLFSRLQAPLLRAVFERRQGGWQMRGIRPIAASEIPDAHHDFVLQAMAEFFTRHRPPARRRPAARYELAILHDPENGEPPSNPKAMRAFAEAAESLGLQPEFITRAELGRLAQFDALFIRDTTFVNHYTYRFARRAAAEGLVVIDDPDSILKCNNKVYLAELLARHRLPAPRTLMVHRDNLDRVVPDLSLPCVLKQPDSSFSIGVTRVDDRDALATRVGELLEKSDLVVAQEWLPTDFDWRIGVLDRRALFACRYYMAEGHWQIVNHHTGGGRTEGAIEAVPLDAVPARVLRCALKAANLVGDGLYGVDIKQKGAACYVIEINDNPNVDAGNEDAVLGPMLYREVMEVFLARLERRRRGGR